MDALRLFQRGFSRGGVTSLAGTRRRGASFGEDEPLRHDHEEHEEIVEHVLSVTTPPGQLEPVCEHGSPGVRGVMDISVHPYVQHLCSTIPGRVSPDRHVLEALWAVFPSVTIAGFPRERAVRLLRTLQSGPRPPYPGVIGWVPGDADCRFSPAIRGVFRYGGLTYLNTGAGIMAESVPVNEFMETEQKLRAAMQGPARVATARSRRGRPDGGSRRKRSISQGAGEAGRAAVVAEMAEPWSPRVVALRPPPPRGRGGRGKGDGRGGGGRHPGRGHRRVKFPGRVPVSGPGRVRRKQGRGFVGSWNRDREAAGRTQREELHVHQ